LQTKIAKDPITEMKYTNAIEVMAKAAAVDFAALDDEDNTQVRLTAPKRPLSRISSIAVLMPTLECV
jgi:hypothetical protein